MKIKDLLFGGADGDSFGAEIGLVILRVFSGLNMALRHGMGKIPPSERFIEGTGELGFPAPEFFSWAAGLSEFGGGILLALGLLTRPSSFFIGCTMAVAGFIRHAADPFSGKEKAFLYLVIMLVFLLRGSGRYGIDAWFRKPEAEV
jgi:putative oxidoreductase